jgi:hypothetical protein
VSEESESLRLATSSVAACLPQEFRRVAKARQGSSLGKGRTPGAPGVSTFVHAAGEWGLCVADPTGEKPLPVQQEAMETPLLGQVPNGLTLCYRCLPSRHKRTLIVRASSAEISNFCSLSFTCVYFGNLYRKAIGFLLSYFHSVLSCALWSLLVLFSICPCWPKAEIQRCWLLIWVILLCPRCQEALCFLHVFPESLRDYCTPVLKEKIMYSPSRKLWLSLSL